MQRPTSPTLFDPIRKPEPVELVGENKTQAAWKAFQEAEKKKEAKGGKRSKSRRSRSTRRKAKRHSRTRKH